MIIVYKKVSYEYDSLGDREKKIMDQEIELAFSKVIKKEVIVEKKTKLQD